MSENLNTQNPVDVAIDEAGRTAQGSVQWLLENRAAKDNQPAITDAPPIYEGNALEFMICGEEGFKAIADDLMKAQASADIVCWGFDPGMELTRGAGNWKRGQTYGELLEAITMRKENPVTVRLLIWYDPVASAKQNNMPGYTDNGTWNPKARLVIGGTPYADTKRQAYCVEWWKRNLPHGSGTGTNPHLQIVLRNTAKTDVQAMLQTHPPEKDQPSEKTTGFVETVGSISEKSLLENYPTHHQKPVLIDYAHDEGSKAVGYVMGLNSVTDFWDTCEHLIDDAKRECWKPAQVKAELQHEKDTQALDGKLKFSPDKPDYLHAKPYQDYACRVVGPALESLHQNFENSWKRFAPPKWQTQGSMPKPTRIPALPRNPAEQVQIVRTQPQERDKSIKALYFQASSFARNYIYIENQYFFYPEFARHLKAERKKFCHAWAKLSNKPVKKLPVLHLFIVIPHPEDDGMVPRTFDMLTELGASETMMAQAKVVDAGGIDQDYPDSQTRKNGKKVLDRAAVKDLESSMGLKVSVARLRTSGLNANNEMAYREIYIHSKLMLIDDVFVTLGSANLNQRSMSVDSEINIAATGQKWASDLRKRVFELHSGGKVVGSSNRDEAPEAFNTWNDLMKQNTQLMKDDKNMQGFLLPFEDHRATSTRHASVTLPSSANTAMA